MLKSLRESARGPRVVFIISFGVIMSFFIACICGDVPPDIDTPPPGAATVVEKPTSTWPAAAPSAEGQTWLVMLYQDGDDEILEKDTFIDFNEAEVVGSGDRVRIVSQFDRFEGAFDGDGDWTSTRRYYVTRDGNLQVIDSQLVEDMGEANMADGDTLVDFVKWAAATYPSDKYVLIMGDHGTGWPGGWSDPDPGGPGRHRIAMSDFGDNIFLMELDDALGKARAQAGIDMFEVVGLDACLMSHVEVMSAVAPHARYFVASQELEPALGWAYAGFLRRLSENPDMSGAELASTIVDVYIEQDTRIVDDEERSELASELGVGAFVAGLFGAEFSADEVTEMMGQDVTLAATDLSAVPGVIAALDELALAMEQSDQELVASARTYAQSFASVFGDDVPPSYIDLGHFALLLRENSGDPAVRQAADRLVSAIDKAVVNEKHGPQKPGATGISIYFPNSDLYTDEYAGHESYTTVANRFAKESLWDDFLVFHYTGRPIDRTATEVSPPPAQAEVVAPGAEQIAITELVLDSDSVAVDGTLTMDADISGGQVAFIYIFVGYYDEESDSILVADLDYIEADATKEIEGVYYPDWEAERKDGVILLRFEWDPVLYAVNDGTTLEFALLQPEEYGSSQETATYSVEGTYTFADGGGSRYAVLYFDGNGNLKEVYGFTGEKGTGAPHEIQPRTGDTFTISESWIEFTEDSEEGEFADYDGGTLTFGDTNFTWEEFPAPAGTYVVGFIAEDMDGNMYEQYETVEVVE